MSVSSFHSLFTGVCVCVFVLGCSYERLDPPIVRDSPCLWTPWPSTCKSPSFLLKLHGPGWPPVNSALQPPSHEFVNLVMRTNQEGKIRKKVSHWTESQGGSHPTYNFPALATQYCPKSKWDSHGLTYPQNLGSKVPIYGVCRRFVFVFFGGYLLFGYLDPHLKFNIG